MSTETPMIKVVDLVKTIATDTHRVEILKGIQLEIPRGQFIAIMGPSGSGKSTLLGLLAGVESATSRRGALAGGGLHRPARESHGQGAGHETRVGVACHPVV